MQPIFRAGNSGDCTIIKSVALLLVVIGLVVFVGRFAGMSYRRDKWRQYAGDEPDPGSSEDEAYAAVDAKVGLYAPERARTRGEVGRDRSFRGLQGGQK